MHTFLIHAVPSQNGSATPVMYVDAVSIDAVPTAVRSYDPDDEHHAELALRLWESIVRDSEFNTVGHIAVSYGGVTHADGSPVDPPANAAEETAISDADSLDVAMPAYFLAWGQSVYQAADSESAPDPEPFLRLTVRSRTHSVSDVEPVGTPGWEYESAMEQMASDVLTAEQLSAYFGSSCYLLPANAAAEQERAAWEMTREWRKANAVRARRRVNPRPTDDPAPAPWKSAPGAQGLSRS